MGASKTMRSSTPSPPPLGSHIWDPLLHCKTWGLCLMSWIIYTQQPLALQCNYNMEKSVSHPDKSNIFLMCFRFWLFDSYSTQNCMRELIAHYSLWVSVQNCARAGTQHRRRGVATSDWLNTLDYLAWAGQLDPTLHNILLGRADPYVQLLDRQYDAKVVYDSMTQIFFFFALLFILI